MTAFILVATAIFCVIFEVLFIIQCQTWQLSPREMMKYIEIQVFVILATWLISVLSLYVGGVLTHLAESASFFGAWVFSLVLIWVSIFLSDWCVDVVQPRFRYHSVNSQLKRMKRYHKNIYHGNTRNARLARRLHMELLALQDERDKKRKSSKGFSKMHQLNLIPRSKSKSKK